MTKKEYSEMFRLLAILKYTAVRERYRTINNKKVNRKYKGLIDSIDNILKWCVIEEDMK